MDQGGNTNQEDKLVKKLINLVEEPNWEDISDDLKSKGFAKSAKQCKDRYI